MLILGVTSAAHVDYKTYSFQLTYNETTLIHMEALEEVEATALRGEYLSADFADHAY